MRTNTGYYRCLEAGKYTIKGEIYPGYVLGGTLVIKDCTGKYGPYESHKFEFVKAQENIFR